MAGRPTPAVFHSLEAAVAALAGVDPTDQRAAAANLPPIDSLDLVPYLMGAVDASPRSAIHLDLNAAVLTQCWCPGDLVRAQENFSQSV